MTRGSDHRRKSEDDPIASIDELLEGLRNIQDQLGITELEQHKIAPVIRQLFDILGRSKKAICNSSRTKSSLEKQLASVEAELHEREQENSELKAQLSAAGGKGSTPKRTASTAVKSTPKKKKTTTPAKKSTSSTERMAGFHSLIGKVEEYGSQMEEEHAQELAERDAEIRRLRTRVDAEVGSAREQAEAAEEDRRVLVARIAKLKAHAEETTRVSREREEAAEQEKASIKREGEILQAAHQRAKQELEGTIARLYRSETDKTTHLRAASTTASTLGKEKKKWESEKKRVQAALAGLLTDFREVLPEHSKELVPGGTPSATIGLARKALGVLVQELSGQPGTAGTLSDIRDMVSEVDHVLEEQGYRKGAAGQDNDEEEQEFARELADAGSDDCSD